MSGLQTVHVRVNDAATGQPTPVRIRITDADRNYYAPFGRLTKFPGNQYPCQGGNVWLAHDDSETTTGAWAYIDGHCEIALPAKTLRVQIAKGPEYRPIDEAIELGPGKMALRFQIERWTDLRAEHWYSGDVESYEIAPHTALLEGAAEDLAVINLLIAELPIGPRKEGTTVIPNALAFSGQEPLLQRPGHLVAVNTFNSAGLLGSLVLLNCHRIVFPLSTGIHGDLPIDWTLADWCDQCHRKRGLAFWAGFGCVWNEDVQGGFSGETLADLLLGKLDGIVFHYLDGRPRFIDEWYRLLNCGIRVPIVGGSRKRDCTNVLGGIRTYARLSPDQDLTYKNWIEAIRAGRTFVTNSPVLSLTVNGQDPGGTITLSPNERRLTIRAEARSQIPFERLELIVNGKAAAAIEPSETSTTAVLEGGFEITGTSWLAARCWGEKSAGTGMISQRVGAHTSPIYVDVPGQPLQPDPISIALIAERLESMRHWAEHGAQFKTDKTRDDLLKVFEAARHVLARLQGGSGG